MKTISPPASAFTLVEMMMTLAIISLLCALIVPSIARAHRYKENSLAADKIQRAVNAFAVYKADKGGWPANAFPGVVPPDMAGYYFPAYGIDWWGDAPEIGGVWDWDFLTYDGKKYAVICIANPTVDDRQLRELDQMIDDGDLSTGDYQKGIIGNSANQNDYGCVVGVL